jgi:uncharacterized membrane protein YebE (DUF533 family)
MAVKNKTKILFKILMGAAWIDGTIQAEERRYLRSMAKAQGLEDDPEIYPLLNELLPVKPEQCYLWINEYLGNSPTAVAYQDLLEAISGLIYSDGSIETEEARLIDRLQRLDPASQSDQTSHGAIVRAIQRLYKRWVNSLS